MLLSRALLRRHSVLPGFDLALGFTLLYLGLIVLVPLAAAFLKTAAMTWPAFWDAVTSPRVLASYRLTFGASFIAAIANEAPVEAARGIGQHAAKRRDGAGRNHLVVGQQDGVPQLGRV